MNNMNDVRQQPFVWFTGVVEDRADPLFLNRVRVRVFGFHTEDKFKLPTEDLPWATVLMPTTVSGVSSIGDGIHGLVEGSWVFGFFKDGTDAQDPVIMGSIMGQNTAGAESTMGFNDPNGIFPREKGIDTSNRAVGLETSLKEPIGVFEPDDPYRAEYPYNKVRITESGHMIEFDDTPGAERINIQHRSGAFIEIHPDNKMRTRSAERFDSMQTWIVNVGGDSVVNVGGNAVTTIQGNSTISVAGKANVDIKGDVVSRHYGDTTAYHTGTTTLNTLNNITLKSLGNLVVEVAGTLSMTSDGDMSFVAPNITMSAVDTITTLSTITNINATATLNTKSENTNIDAAVSLNTKSTFTNIDAAVSLNTKSTSTTINGTASVTVLGSIVNLNPIGGSPIGGYPGSFGASVSPLPIIEFTTTELEVFPIIIEEADIDISFPTPKFSVVKPDGSTSYSKQTSGYMETGLYGASAFTGDSMSIIDSGDGNLDVESLVLLSGDGTGSVVYINQYATRDKALVSELESIIVSAAKKTKLDAQIFSGGMTPTKRTGSDRHLHGYGCDVWIFNAGVKLNVNDSLFQAFAKACKDAGATSIGAGTGYMGSVGLHVDIAKGNTIAQSGTASYWGAGGRSANAPSWLISIMKG